MDQIKSIPIIETERLRLRAHEIEDFDACVEMWSDPIVTRYTVGELSPAPRTWQRLLAYRGHWSLLGFGYWVVEEKVTQRYIGELGFADFRRGLDASLSGLPEMGWALSPHVHGKGYATEALKEVLEWGAARFGSTKVVCIINSENAASLKVADKIGFREFKRLKKENRTEDILFERKLIGLE